jgi:AcrR family transcriptional regulator
MPKGIPLTEVEIETRRREIVEAARDLILSKGFRETSMREIAQAAGTGKSTLYDYFTSKEDILVYMLSEPVDEMTTWAREIIYSPGTATERLQRLMHTHLDFLLDKKAYVFRLSIEAQRLSAEAQAQIQTKRHAYQDMLQALVEEGIDAGEFRPVNAAMTMKTLLAIMTPVVFTTRPVGSPEEMLDDALDLLFRGVQS